MASAPAYTRVWGIALVGFRGKTTGQTVRVAKNPEADHVFVSGILIFDAPVINISQITISMIHMLHTEPLKMHTFCNNTR